MNERRKETSQNVQMNSRMSKKFDYEIDAENIFDDVNVHQSIRAWRIFILFMSIFEIMLLLLFMHHANFEGTPTILNIFIIIFFCRQFP